MKVYDAIVLGAGGVGSAALYSLARRGLKAIGVDRFRPPHDRGSTHGHTRVIRQAYFEHPDYVPLLKESYRLWNELEHVAGRRLYHEIGLVEVGPADGVVVPGVLRAAAEHGLSVDHLSATAANEKWPGLNVPSHLEAVHESHAGYLLVEDCVQAHLDAARAAGAELLTDTEVISWSTNDDEVRVETSQGSLIAGRLIIAAGAWANAVINESRPAGSRLPTGGRLTVRRKSLFWFQCDTPEYDVANGFPIFLFEFSGGIFYGFPKMDSRGVKVAEHTGGRVVDDPLAVDRSVDATEQQRIADFLAAHLPGVSDRVVDHAACLYTMSPDEHFIVDRHPLHRNVVFAAGLSGHGFKFVPVLGEALADFATDGATSLPVSFLSAVRFSNDTTS